MVSIFVKVDENGEILNSISGKFIIPDREYDFHFYRDVEVMENIMDYKVIMNGYQSDLVKKSID